MGSRIQNYLLISMAPYSDVASEGQKGGAAVRAAPGWDPVLCSAVFVHHYNSLVPLTGIHLRMNLMLNT